jgi:hypothetical protein
MYKVTCCRKGKYITNVGNKGCFIKEFKTLSEFAKFAVKSYNSLFFPDLLKNFNRSEISILYKKIHSLIERKKL